MVRCIVLLAAWSIALSAADAKSPNIPLWDPGKAPLAKGDGPLDAPFLTISLPPSGKGNGASVIVAPGGGNIMMMYGAEGLEIAERFNEWGAAAFVLTYRLQPYGEDARVMDGNRAIQIIRSRAKEWNLDANKIGFAGYYNGAERDGNKTHSNASPYGAFDMAGNLMEWCADWYSRDYYAASPRKNPKGPAAGAYRVVRGGSFYIDAFDQRVYM